MKLTRMIVVCALLATGVPAFAGMAERITRVKVAGVDVIVYPTAVKDVVTIVGALPAGEAHAGNGNAAVPALTGAMLDRGTTMQDKFAIANKLDSVGAGILFGVSPQTLDIQARCLKQDLPLVLRLIAEQLRAPAFASAELEKARQQYIGRVQAATENTQLRAQSAFLRAVFPTGHPNRPYSAAEYVTAAQNATLKEVQAFHRAHYGPAHLTLVLVGDVDLSLVKREVSKAYAGWQGGIDVVQSDQPVSAAATLDELVPLAGKTSVSIFLGQRSGVRYKDQDALALRVGTAILGSGFTGRLMATVRDQEGLTYGIGAMMDGDTFNSGSWNITATFAPQLLDKGIASTRRELEKWWSHGVTELELTERKENLIGGYEVGLATTNGMAAVILATVQRGYELTWLDEYPKAVRALTVEQVNGAIKKHLDPANMVLVKAGTVMSPEGSSGTGQSAGAAERR